VVRRRAIPTRRELRVKEVLETGANTLAVCCPFCLNMLSDALAHEDPDARVLDMAELLAEKLPPLKASNASRRSQSEKNRKDQKP